MTDNTPDGPEITWAKKPIANRVLGILASQGDQKWHTIGLLLAVCFGFVIWNVPVAAPLDQNGMHFLAVLTVAVVLWVFEVFDEVVVALLLLLSWLVLAIVPPPVALGGFGKNSWIFIVGALGIGAAVNKSGLLYRLGIALLRKFPPQRYKTLTFVLLGSGLITTPFLPGLVRARATLMATLSNAISKTIDLEPRSNGSAGLGLAAYMACGQLSFVFLTGAGYSLVCWNLLPEDAQASFGWFRWTVAALPAGITTFLLLYAGIVFLFPLRQEDLTAIATKSTELQAEQLEPLTRSESLTLSVLLMAIAGWLTKPWHHIDESWIALAALVVFMVSGVLDKKTFRSGIDWGLILFFGIVNSLAAVAMHLGIDRWLVQQMTPVLSYFSFHPMGFLLVIVAIVYLTRVFLRKMPAAIVLTVVLIPWAPRIGLHPGILLITILIALEFLVLPYQDGPYQIFYSSSEGKSFSHGQTRKLMVAKFVASFVAVAISVPYWTWLGLIDARALVEDKNAVKVSVDGNGGSAGRKLPAPEALKKDLVASLQEQLRSKGHNPGAIDGIFGPRTRRAIREYQRKVGLPDDGVPSGQLLRHLQEQSQ